MESAGDIHPASLPYPAALRQMGLVGTPSPKSITSVGVSTDVIKRPPRRAAPALPSGELTLEPPPAIPQSTGARWQQWLSVLPMLAGTVATAMMFGGREGASTYTYIVGGIFGLSTLGMLITNWGGATGPRKFELLQARRDYLRHLAGARRRVRTAITNQRRAMYYRHPDPQALWSEALSIDAPGHRVWERRPVDADFGVVRVGIGPQSLATTLVPPVIDPSADLEPVTAGALRRFLNAYAVVPDLPISIAMRSFTRVIVTDAGATNASAGSPGACALARAIVAQLVTFHAPRDLRVAACVDPQRRRDWEWLKWLPHALHPTATDSAGPRRLVATSMPGLEDLLADVRRQAGPTSESPAGAEPHVILVTDGAAAAAYEGRTGVTVLDVGAAAPRSLDRTTIVLTVAADGALDSSTLDGSMHVGQADVLGVVGAESLARLLAPLRLEEEAGERAALSADRTLTDLLGIADISTADIGAMWTPRAAPEVLRIPIGTGPDGSPVDLDLKEAAQNGMGPHGLIVGATGSGKSELLRTLVLGLAATHSSEALNVVLVDFKGGATFASLDRLPHTSAVITNLEDALPLVDRMKDAMSGELTRRQEVLRRAGPFSSLRDYDRARAGGADLAPLPSLLLVCDEFTEMLTAKPDLIDLFVQIGRIGRSIGVHLLLATQRLEEGRLRGLETNLSYRIALRTFTAHESRMTLGGASDAAELPATPGHGFLRVGTGPLRRFKAAYVSGPYRADRPTATSVHSGQVLDYTTHHAPPRVGTDPTPGQSDEPPTPSLMEVVIGRLAGRGASAHRVWLPPLRQPPSLDDMLGRLVSDPGRGATAADATLQSSLRVPVALVDRPYEQRRDIAWLDLAGSSGHIAIVGGPQSGKSTAVRSIVTALALTHTPREVQVYCLDFGGGSLGALRGLPHVGGVAGRLDTATVRRTVGEIVTLLADRERSFAAEDIESMAALRLQPRSSTMDSTPAPQENCAMAGGDQRGAVAGGDQRGAVAGGDQRGAVAGGDQRGAVADVFLVVDGWATLRNEYEDLEATLVDVATRGLGYGIHLVATATRWTDLRHTIKDLFGSRLELRLGDPSDSAVDRRSAANVPDASPGRGLTMDGLHLLTALPRVSGHDPAAVVEAISAAWTGPSAPPVRMLPALLPYEAVLATAESGDRLPVGLGLCLPLGIAEADLRTVLVDFASESHLVAFGDSECGKSTLLRSLAESITLRFSPDQARIVIIDYRRSLLGAVRSDHLIGYGTAAVDTTSLIESVGRYMDSRRPGPDVTPEHLRDRSWWTGPDCFVLVDDYDLVATAAANPLLPLLDHLSHARDVGLHVVVTRRVGGAGRALYEPVLQRLRELGTPTLVMSGDRDEGVLVGAVRPGPQPPGRGWLVTRKEGTRLVQLAYLGAYTDPRSRGS